MFDWLLDDPVYVVAVAVVGVAIAFGVRSGRKNTKVLEALQQEHGGEVIKRSISPSSLVLRSETRVIELVGSLGSNSNTSGGSSTSAAIIARVFFLDWRGQPSPFDLSRPREGVGAAVGKLIGKAPKPPLAIGDPELEGWFRLTGDQASLAPWVAKMKPQLRKLRELAAPHDVHVRFSPLRAPEQHTWKRGDPVFGLPEGQTEPEPVPSLSLVIDGRSGRSLEETDTILRAVMELADSLPRV